MNDNDQERIVVPSSNPTANAASTWRRRELTGAHGPGPSPRALWLACLAAAVVLIAGFLISSMIVRRPAVAPTPPDVAVAPAVERTPPPPPPAVADPSNERVIHGNADVASGDQTGGAGQVDANAVARIIRGQIGGIRACFERELRHTPTLSGRLEMRFTIGPSGRITGISAGGPLNAAAPPVGSCVSGRLRGLVFPAPTGGDVEFMFPFTFAPG